MIHTLFQKKILKNDGMVSRIGKFSKEKFRILKEKDKILIANPKKLLLKDSDEYDYTRESKKLRTFHYVRKNLLAPKQVI